MLLWMLHIQLIWSRVRLHVFMCAWMKASLSSLFAIMLSLRQKHQGSSTPLSRHLPLLCECMCAVYVFCLPVRILICQVAVRHMYAYFLSHFLHPHHPPFFFSLNICQPLSDKQCTEFHFNPIVFACVRGNVNFDNVWFSFLSNMTVIACRPLGWCVSVYVCVHVCKVFPSIYVYKSLFISPSFPVQRLLLRWFPPWSCPPYCLGTKKIKDRG